MKRRSTTSQATPDTAKKSVHAPVEPSKLFSLFFFSVLRKPVSVSINAKIGLYLCLVTGGSIITDFIKVPPTYFSSKYNLINLFFAKWAWGWTVIPLTSFIILSSYVYSAGKKGIMQGHLMRILLGSTLWYVCTNTFREIERMTGYCSSMSSNKTLVQEVRKVYTNQYTCRKNGGTWLGFDISGHCFLMVLCNLWIMEELKVLLNWNVLGAFLNCNDDEPDGKLTVRELKFIQTSYSRHSNLLRWLFCFLSCLSVLWDFVLFTTILYYHNMPTKVLGTLTALACHFIVYRLLCPLAKSGDFLGFFPGLPGDGKVHFMGRRSN